VFKKFLQVLHLVVVDLVPGQLAKVSKLLKRVKLKSWPPFKISKRDPPPPPQHIV
jgi:hypothetical protein